MKLGVYFSFRQLRKVKNIYEGIQFVLSKFCFYTISLHFNTSFISNGLWSGSNSGFEVVGFNQAIRGIFITITWNLNKIT